MLCAVMGHGGMSKRSRHGLVLSPSTPDDNRLDNALPQFPRPPSPDRPSPSLLAHLGGHHDRRPHGLFPPPAHLHRAPPGSFDNPLFPLISAGDKDRVGGRALLREFLTFLDLKGAHFAPLTLSVASV